MEILFVLAIIIGLLHAYKSIYDVRIGIQDSAKSSRTPSIDFVFLINNNK